MNILKSMMFTLAYCATFYSVSLEQLHAGFVYRTGSNSSSSGPALHEFDTATNTWSTRASLPAGNTTQLASDGDTLYSLTEDGNIYSYDRNSDAWSFVQSGPGASVGRNPISMFEVHNGEFYWANDGTLTLHYTNNGVWDTIASPRQISSASSIDKSSDQIYIRTYTQLGGLVFDIGANSFTDIFDNATSVGENARTGEFYDGSFYSRTFFGNIQQVDTTTGAATDTGVSLATAHSGSAIGPDGLLYLSGYSGSALTFEVLDLNTNILTTLPDAPAAYVGDHNTLAYVGTSASAPVPEPSSVAIFGIGAVALGFVAYRRKKKAGRVTDVEL